jgi:inner membrane protein
MTWWIWLLVGFALLAGELLTPGGFYVVFFGVGALLVGILVGLGVSGPQWTQWLLFSVFSIASLLLFRGRLLAWSRDSAPARAVDALVGEVATPLEDLPRRGVGKAELRGTAWTAYNADDRPLVKGQRCRVERVEGLTLWIRGEEAGGRA